MVKYIFAQAQSAGASHRFCGEMEQVTTFDDPFSEPHMPKVSKAELSANRLPLQVVRKLSADQGVQRSILEAWEKEERLKAIRDLSSSERRQAVHSLQAASHSIHCHADL